MTDRPRVDIEYCTQCRWLLRAAWTAQELLMTFDESIADAEGEGVEGDRKQCARNDQAQALPRAASPKTRPIRQA